MNKFYALLVWVFMITVSPGADAGADEQSQPVQNRQATLFWDFDSLRFPDDCLLAMVCLSGDPFGDDWVFILKRENDKPEGTIILGKRHELVIITRYFIPASSEIIELASEIIVRELCPDPPAGMGVGLRITSEPLCIIKYWVGGEMKIKEYSVNSTPLDEMPDSCKKLIDLRTAVNKSVLGVLRNPTVQGSPPETGVLEKPEVALPPSDVQSDSGEQVQGSDETAK